MQRYALQVIVAAMLLVSVHRASVAAEGYEAITDAEIAKLNYEDAEEDMGFVCPWAQNLEHLDDDQKKRIGEWMTKVGDWEPGKVDDVGQRVKNYCCLMGLMDIAHGEWEGEAPIKIYEKLVQEIPLDKLKKAAAWAYLKPEAGTVISTLKELDIEADVDADFVRDRSSLYAKKVLGRLMNKLPIRYDEKGNRLEPGQVAPVQPAVQAPATGTQPAATAPATPATGTAPATTAPAVTPAATAPAAVTPAAPTTTPAAPLATHTPDKK